MSASNFLETRLLEGTLTGNTYTAPANVYAALFSTTLTDAVSGTEITGNGYSRQAVAFAVTGALAENTGNITFTCTGNAWPTVRAFALFDASSTGNALYWTNIIPISVQATENVVFTTDSIQVTAE